MPGVAVMRSGIMVEALRVWSRHRALQSYWSSGGLPRFPGRAGITTTGLPRDRGNRTPTPHDFQVVAGSTPGGGTGCAVSGSGTGVEGVTEDGVAARTAPGRRPPVPLARRARGRVVRAAGPAVAGRVVVMLVAQGSIAIPVGEVLRILTGRGAASEVDRTIVLDARLPCSASAPGRSWAPRSSSWAPVAWAGCRGWAWSASSG
ncbi:hypothetical protein EDD40_7549 [Saccharothrix texasensis]|uniref:Uncharacterized protein n=1 Tax=Saccharothrix texasensis TaxID=103734 RepID=A0A3N1HHR0_9PSEU|nr:hypothetical protein EDD40_7549 [Saccharothrix texasensis]